MSSNEQFIQRLASGLNTFITASSDFDVIASPSMADGTARTVTIKGFNNPGISQGSCTASSVTGGGNATSSVTQNMVSGFWTLTLPFTAAQVPASNVINVRCTLLAQAHNKIHTMSIATP